LKLHFPVWLNVVVVKVGVEHNDRISNEEHCVRMDKLPTNIRVTAYVAGSERLKRNTEIKYRLHD